jgi:hypothetical protein
MKNSSVFFEIRVVPEDCEEEKNASAFFEVQPSFSLLIVEVLMTHPGSPSKSPYGLPRILKMRMP